MKKVTLYYRNGTKESYEGITHVWGGSEVVLISGTEEVKRVSNNDLTSYEVW